MDRVSRQQQQNALTHGAKRNEASLRVNVGHLHIEGQVSVSTPGLLAIGGLVSSILLSVAVIVLASTRKLPDGRYRRICIGPDPHDGADLNQNGSAGSTPG
ncbi:hypothetical protein [Aureimonas sp. Leaf427]|nr:hypothetical protein [Aureimonas sp. Leaf427]